MKTLYLAMGACLLLAACAPLTVDREFGQAQQTSWDKQVAYPDYRFAGNTVEGYEGITAENIMQVYHQTFAEQPAKTEVYQFDLQQVKK